MQIQHLIDGAPVRSADYFPTVNPATQEVLAEVARREDAALRDAAERALGAGSAEAPRAILKWVARVVGR